MEELTPNEQFVQLFAELNHRIYAFVVTLLPHAADADEVFQKTSIVLWQKFGDYEQGTDFVRWACRVAQLEVMNFRRAQSRSPLVFNDELLGQLAFERLDEEPLLARRTEALQHCLGQLRSDDRALVEQFYCDDLTVPQIAERSGAQPNTLYKALARVRRALFRCINRTLNSSESG